MICVKHICMSYAQFFVLFVCIQVLPCGELEHINYYTGSQHGLIVYALNCIRSYFNIFYVYLLGEYAVVCIFCFL